MLNIAKKINFVGSINIQLKKHQKINLYHLKLTLDFQELLVLELL